MIGAIHIYGYQTSDGSVFCRACAVARYGDPPFEQRSTGRFALLPIHDYNYAAPEHYDEVCDDCGGVVVEAYHDDPCDYCINDQS